MVLEDHHRDNLNSLLKRIYKIEPDLGIFIAFKITQGLKELREIGSVYRELSTKSVLFKQQEGCPAIIKISDFIFDPKIRKFLEESQEDKTIYCTYRAPEVYDTTLPQDAGKEDIWSLGCIMYELLYGEGPFLATSQKEFLSIA